MAVTEKYTSSYIAVAKIDGKEAFMHMEAYDHITAARVAMTFVREVFPAITAFDVEIRDRFADDFDRLTQTFHVTHETYGPGGSFTSVKAVALTPAVLFVPKGS